VADSGHVLRSGAGSQAAEILVEHHVEDPVQTVLDMPMASHGVGEQFGVKRHGGQVVAPFEAGAAVALDLGLDHGNGGQPGEPRLAGEPPCGGEPVDLVADHVAADLDAAMVAIGRLEVAVVFGGGVVEIAPDLVVQTGLVVLEREQAPPRSRMAWAILVCVPMASMVTSAPVSARRSRRSGMAVISLDLASHACCPSTRRWLLAHAETRCSGPRSLLRS